MSYFKVLLVDDIDPAGVEVLAATRSITPIVHNQIVIVSGLGLPVTGFRVMSKAGQWTSEDVWVNNDVTIVTNGLSAGEHVVVGGQYRLQPGSRVDAKPETAANTPGQAS